MTPELVSAVESSTQYILMKITIHIFTLTHKDDTHLESTHLPHLKAARLQTSGPTANSIPTLAIRVRKQNGRVLNTYKVNAVP